MNKLLPFLPTQNSNQRFQTSLILGLSMGLLGFSACSKDDDTGSIVVPFALGADLECASVEVEEVRVTLTPMQESSDSATNSYEEITECDQGEITFEQIPVGLYQVKAEGLAADETVIFDNEANNDIAEVFAEQMSQASLVRMSASPAKLTMKLSLFENGDQIDCNDVVDTFTHIKVSAFEDNGTNFIFEYAFPCDVGLQDPAPDPERKLSGKDTDTVQVRLVDSKGNGVGVPQTLDFIPVGPGRTIQVKVSFDKGTSGITAELEQP